MNLLNPSGCDLILLPIPLGPSLSDGHFQLEPEGSLTLAQGSWMNVAPRQKAVQSLVPILEDSRDHYSRGKMEVN